MNRIVFGFGLVLFSVTFISACAHHPDVRAGVDGIHRVVISTDDKEAGTREAIRQANSFCKERNMSEASSASVEPSQMASWVKVTALK